MTKVLLKGRPTPAQLADRLAPPLPEGLELYLDACDIYGREWLEALRGNVAQASCPPGFSWIVEGPLRSLDGRFFDISEHSEANLEVLRRLVKAGEALGAAGVVIHAIAPVSSPSDLTVERRQRALESGARFLRHYADLCHRVGLVPSIENIPPVARMREESYTYSLLGVDTEDLITFAGAVDGLRATFDISHCGLFVNGLAMQEQEVEPFLRPLLRWLGGLSAKRTVAGCIERLGGLIWNVHVSNSRGLLDEGLPYHEGDSDIDALIPVLASTAEFIVTETLEPDPDQAIYMREAQRRIERALRRHNTEEQGAGGQ